MIGYHDWVFLDKLTLFDGRVVVRNRECEEEKWVLGNADLLAFVALQLGLELACEILADHTFVAAVVNVPGLLREFFLVGAVEVVDLDLRLLDDPVQVLVQQVQEQTQELR